MYRAQADPYRSVQGELARICSLPIVNEPGPELKSKVEELMVRPEAWNSPGWKGLLDKQAEAIAVYLTLGGSLFAPIGVGQGKTGITLMCASLAQSRFRHKRTMLVIQNKLVPQLMIGARGIPWWAKYVRLNTNFINLHRKTRAQRARYYRIKQPGCYVVPYSLLQTQDASEMLGSLCPETIIFDECHNLSNRSSARTDRIFGRHGYLATHGAKICGLSGTITKRNLTDYYHLIRACLGKSKVPMPNDHDIRKAWDNVLSSERGGIPLDLQDPMDLQAVYPLLIWARQFFPDMSQDLTDDLSGMRRAYRVRLITCPGVVSTSDDKIGVGLNLKISEPPQPPSEDTKELFKKVDSMMTPDDRVIPHAMHKWMYHWVLSSGFYYEPRWPATATEEDIAIAQQYLEALQAYNTVLRDYLKNNRRPGHDTPFLVGQAMQRRGEAGVSDPGLFTYWKYKQDCKALVRIKPVSWGVHVDDFKLKQVARDIEELEDQKAGCLVWYQHQFFGRQLFEHLSKKFGGQKVVHCPAGAKYDALIIDHALRDKIVVASMSGHGEGKELQYGHQAVFAQLPPSAVGLQQVAGRQHRRGQERDEVNYTFSLGTEFEHAMLQALIMDATYQHSTAPQEQKILAATWVNPPREFPESYLIEHGLRSSGATEREKASLERFSLDFEGSMLEDES